mmetsp:Transcript_2705/g.3423  ORF Transcript_2705/g.3423 Transcript_2705/m.3423 type:complete len:314 (-) Transcript_2705:274-1215(-)|eukprot:CAMPEP_0204823932 /NCGR_PEP_ID=MMETSP1346-20131115/2010_1 /ASSEMBLY_ACC=CAM_ASM_000771 /TAXON_ID=215587 /ORGANISM="Aplanochytrium stocchinoi, Strain GSBS06" /LENGTH=313 /DNA_ID=CAMNT_0051950825 /DNA_START=123 /DNA_END=1064 /DNA_ORIENTATION=+
MKSRAWAFVGALGGGVIGVSPFLGWILFGGPESYFTSRVSELVNSYDYHTWKKGDKRPHRIILLRHGQTHGYSHTCDCQVAGLKVCALKPDIERPLTEEGKLQSLQAGVALKRIIGYESVTFYASPYNSCKQTFAYVAGSFQNKNSCQYVEDPRLRNQDFGDWHLKEAPEKMAEFKKQAERVGKFYYRWPEGESATDVYDRTSSFMETLYRKWKQTDRPDNYVIITHSIVIQTFLMRWFHWDVETFNRLRKFKNGQLAVMEKQPNGSYKLVTPLPCKPPVPDGVKFLANNPQRSESKTKPKPGNEAKSMYSLE